MRWFATRLKSCEWSAPSITKQDSQVPQHVDACQTSATFCPASALLGQHDALAAAARQLEAGEFLAAFLDYIYVVTATATIEREAGVAANLGKTRVYHARGSSAPPGMHELGEDMWCGDKPPAQHGFVALGVPVGHPEFIRSCASGRLEEERCLLLQLPELPDLQCACAQHLLRTVPPAAIAECARAHDDAVRQTTQDMLGGQAADAEALAGDLDF